MFNENIVRYIIMFFFLNRFQAFVQFFFFFWTNGLKSAVLGVNDNCKTPKNYSHQLFTHRIKLELKYSIVKSCQVPHKSEIGIN